MRYEATHGQRGRRSRRESIVGERRQVVFGASTSQAPSRHRCWGLPFGARRSAPCALSAGTRHVKQESVDQTQADAALDRHRIRADVTGWHAGRDGTFDRKRGCNSVSQVAQPSGLEPSSYETPLTRQNRSNPASCRRWKARSTEHDDRRHRHPRKLVERRAKPADATDRRAARPCQRSIGRRGSGVTLQGAVAGRKRDARPSGIGEVEVEQDNVGVEGDSRGGAWRHCRAAP